MVDAVSVILFGLSPLCLSLTFLLLLSSCNFSFLSTKMNVALLQRWLSTWVLEGEVGSFSTCSFSCKYNPTGHCEQLPILIAQYSCCPTNNSSGILPAESSRHTPDVSQIYFQRLVNIPGEFSLLGYPFYLMEFLVFRCQPK